MSKPTSRQRNGDASDTLLEASEERFRLLVESVEDYAIFILDPEGHVITWNRGAERLKGYRADEIIGQHFSRFYTPEDRERGHPAEVLAHAAEAGRHLEEGWRVRSDGTRFWASLVLTAMRNPDGELAGFAKVTRDLTGRKAAEEELQRAHDELEGRVVERTAELTRANAALRERELQLSDFVENAPVGLHWVAADGTILWANRAELEMLGYSRDEYEGRHIAEFHADTAAIQDTLRRLAANETLSEYAAVLRCKDGSLRHVLINSNVLWEDGRFVHTRSFTRDITAEKRSEALLTGQRQLLERIALSTPLPEVLEAISRFVEQQADGAFCSILLLDEAGRLRHGAAPSLPADYNQAIDGLAIGPAVGSCGTAAYRREPVIVTDIASDPLWAGFAPLALRHGLRACWSTPIRASEGTVLGTVAMYYRTPRSPSEGDTELTGMATRLAGIAIERARAEEALRRRAEELAEKDRQKDEFLAMLAHELRNPLAPIIHAAQVLKARIVDDPVLQRQQQMMERQARHMGRLLDDLLDVSRITRGKVELRREAVDLVAAVEQAVESSRPLIEGRQHRFTAVLPPGPVWVDADATRLHQVIGNLLNNAAKYTEPGGRVTLSLEVEEEAALIRVADTGVGIDPAFLPQIFDLFAQGDRSLRRTESGLGVGLTMVKRLVELHGGTVTAHSAGRGKGSEFVVRWPRTELKGLPRSTAPGEDRSAESGVSRRVLIVDDNRDAAETLADLIEMWGHEVRAVHDGRSAITTAAAYRPDVIILDISMPGMDGFEVARRLRNRTEITGVTLIALTGYGQQGDRDRAFAAGFNEHLTKPVDPAALRELLSQDAAELLPAR